MGEKPVRSGGTRMRGLYFEHIPVRNFGRVV